MLDHEADLAFDFRTELRIDDPDELDAADYFAYAWRLAVNGKGAVNASFRAMIRDSEGSPNPPANQRNGQAGVVDVRPEDVVVTPPVWSPLV